MLPRIKRFLRKISKLMAFKRNTRHWLLSSRIVWGRLRRPLSNKSKSCNNLKPKMLSIRGHFHTIETWFRCSKLNSKRPFKNKSFSTKRILSLKMLMNRLLHRWRNNQGHLRKGFNHRLLCLQLFRKNIAVIWEIWRKSFVRRPSLLRKQISTLKNLMMKSIKSKRNLNTWYKFLMIQA